MISDTAPANRVLVLRQEVLPRSETFIKQQTKHLVGWNAILLGVFKSKPSLDLSDTEHHILENSLDVPAFNRIWGLAKTLGLADKILLWKTKKLTPNLIHIHFGVDAVRFSSFIRKSNLPVVITLHGYDVNISSEWWNSGNAGKENVGYHEKLTALVKGQRISCIAVSKAIRRRALELGIPDSKITVLHIGVDTKFFTPQGAPIRERANRILFVGRLTEKKGCDLLLKATAHAKLCVPDISVVVVGDGPDLARYKGLSNELGLATDFRGSLSSEQVREELNLCRVLCLPSIKAENGDAEGLPIVLLEAQACGVPVVTSANGGTEEGMVDGTTGIAFAEGDVLALANGLIRILTDDDFAQHLSEHARDFTVKNFSLAQCSGELSKYYDQATRNGN